MCEKCDAIDEKIARYRRWATYLLDQRMVDQTKKLINELEAQKAALHAE